MTSRKLCWVVAALIFLIGAMCRVGAAEFNNPPGQPDRYGILWNTPIYDPGSKRYFALMESHDPNNLNSGRNWEQDSAAANALEFKGVHGRLAVVDSLEVHQFLERTFRPREYIWIGLRYLCGPRKFQTSDGKTFTSFAFQAWDQAWLADKAAQRATGVCVADSMRMTNLIMPVAYTPVSEGFRWIGKGWAKGYVGYFVEYPTGHP